MASQQQQHGPQVQGPQMRLQPGQQPTPEQIAAMQRQLALDAQKAGMTVPQFVEKLKAQAIAQQQAAQQQQAMAQAQQQQQQQPINPGPPNPAAIAVAKFLKGQDLKMRTCILNGQRKDMFKGKLTFVLAATPDANVCNSQARVASPSIRCIHQSPQKESSPP
jgi:translocation protein SEC62